MNKILSWEEYVSEDGDFELASYLYHMILSLMKYSLDMGTLLSSDPVRLRAYKEQTKTTFKSQWLEIAEALESFDMITPCVCDPKEYCKLCSGSRYRLSSSVSPDQLREMVMAVSDKELQPEIIAKLEEGLKRALEEVSQQ